MRRYAFVTVDVFTDRRFGGNPLAVFTDAAGLSDAEMQSLAREFNLSETTFVLPPASADNTARVRIFTPMAELPFAGHPNVGTGFVLADRATAGRLRFEEIAGLVEVSVERDPAGAVGAVTIAAPRPLSLGPELPAAVVADCLGLVEAEVRVGAHRPVQAGTGNPFVFAELTPGALTRALPDLAQLRSAAAEHGPRGIDRLSLYVYARDGGRLRSRLFAPLLGVAEDPATGSAATTVAALLLSIDGGERAAFEIMQGVEMGRPSLLRAAAWRAPDGIRASVGGGCVPVLRGEALLD